MESSHQTNKAYTHLDRRPREEVALYWDLEYVPVEIERAPPLPIQGPLEEVSPVARRHSGS